MARLKSCSFFFAGYVKTINLNQAMSTIPTSKLAQLLAHLYNFGRIMIMFINELKKEAADGMQVPDDKYTAQIRLNIDDEKRLWDATYSVQKLYEIMLKLNDATKDNKAPGNEVHIAALQDALRLHHKENDILFLVYHIKKLAPMLCLFSSMPWPTRIFENFCSTSNAS
jgi:hypothetical protein